MTELVIQIISDSISIIDSLNQDKSNPMSPFSINSIIGYLLSGIVGLFIGITYSLFIEAEVHKFISKRLPKLLRKRKTLTARWEQNWHVTSSSFPAENKSEVNLKQRRNHVFGNFSVINNEGKQYTYYMSGKVRDDRYIEGEWYDEYQGHTYYGTFLLSIDVNMDSLKGYWVGSTKDNSVKSDRWEWKRLH